MFMKNRSYKDLVKILTLILVGTVIVSGCSRVNTLTDEDIKAELKNLEEINTSPNNMNIDPDDYPKVLGIYSENGINLVERYHCSDVCPNYGGVSIVFSGNSPSFTSDHACL